MSNALRIAIHNEQVAILDYIRNDETGFAVDINPTEGLTFTGKVEEINGRIFHEISDAQNTQFLVCMFDDGSAYVVLDRNEAYDV